jgi:hypothetical protein
MLLPWRCLASARPWVGCYQSSLPRRARTACVRSSSFLVLEFLVLEHAVFGKLAMR